jgi:hypothetical protein
VACMAHGGQMSRFRMHLIGGRYPLLIEVVASSLCDLAAEMRFSRYLVVRLLAEGDDCLDEPVAVLVPTQRVQLIAEVGGSPPSTMSVLDASPQ